ncbi:uncharacterized protein V1516DRAFT_669078 [Lipomyces oligophaga]|uniref:uncharacterized protein n=1 Tax=Lipomyces oligophaga TaxID=45792 RepID=UPI0034CFD427
MSKRSSRDQQVAAPTIPHSEETKYRQKCKDLKKRISEVEESNNLLILRLARSKRGVQRMRLERAFLLEKLEERTFFKVDDSEGSPSPPASPVRSHKRVALRGGESDGSVSPMLEEHTTGGFTAIASSGNNTSTPSAAKSKLLVNQAGQVSTPGTSSKRKHTPRDPHAPRRPQNAYIIFCDLEKERVRNQLIDSQGKDNFDLTKAMAEAWRDLGDDGRKRYYQLYDAEKARYNREMEAYVPPGSVLPVTASSPLRDEKDIIMDADIEDSYIEDADEENDKIDLEGPKNTNGNGNGNRQDEDEEMDDASFGRGGFTAVNRR